MTLLFSDKDSHITRTAMRILPRYIPLNTPYSAPSSELVSYFSFVSFSQLLHSSRFRKLPESALIVSAFRFKVIII